MKLIECVNAYTALGALMKQETDFRSAYAMTRLRRRLEPHARYYAEEEARLVRKFARKDEGGEPVFVRTNEFAFEDSAGAAEFRRLREGLAEVDIDEEIGQVRISRPERITPEILYALEGLVVFEEAEA